MSRQEEEEEMAAIAAECDEDGNLAVCVREDVLNAVSSFQNDLVRDFMLPVSVASRFNELVKELSDLDFYVVSLD